MKITMLLTVGIDRPSGIRYFSLARELVRRGHQVQVLALHPDLASCPQRRFVRDGVRVWYVGQMHARKGGSLPHTFAGLALLRVLLLSTLGLLWGLLRSPADVYHLGKPQPINSAAALPGLLLRGLPFYLDCDDDEAHSNRFAAAWQRQVFAFWQWLMPALAAGVTVNTRFLEQRMQCRGVAPVVYVPNGVDTARFQPAPAAIAEGLRAALGLEGRRVVAYVGSLALQNHPVDLLVDAFAAVVRQHPQAVLLIVGGGEDLPALREQVRQRGLQSAVFFTGRVPYESIPGWLSLAELSADPVYDNVVARARSPLKIFESMALGVPVVTGDVGDRAVLLAEGRAGVLVEPGSAAALAAGICQILADPARQQALKHACQQHVQHYTWQALAARWEQVYAAP